MTSARPGEGPLLGRLFLLTLLALSLFTPEWASAGTWADGSADHFELRARWSVFLGPFQRGGKLILRQLDDRRVSVRVDLPDLDWLPDRQYLLREGEALLDWQEPEGARTLLDRGDAPALVLGELPPAGLAALLTGRGLADLLTEVSEERRGGWTTLTGRLAGFPAELRLGINRALTLDLRLPEGIYRFSWREGAAGAELTLRLPQGYKLRFYSRVRGHVRLEQEDWLFLSE